MADHDPIRDAAVWAVLESAVTSIGDVDRQRLPQRSRSRARRRLDRPRGGRSSGPEQVRLGPHPRCAPPRRSP